MPRILYLVACDGGIQGGHKVVFRHVEALRDLGFDAACYIVKEPPRWFEHRAPMVHGGLRDDDVLVLPDDAEFQIRACAERPAGVIVLTQNPYFMARDSLDALDLYPPQRFPAFIAVAPRLAATVTRLYPQATVEVVPCFADERIFQPAEARREMIAFIPRKRPTESRVIRNLFRKLYPEHRGLLWGAVQNATERQTADALGSCALFLSLSRLESVGMAPLEAMASGCLCAGFTGVGGVEFATPQNGFWVPEDDCEAAADAMASAADVLRGGGAPLRQRLEAGYETARQWSYAAFRTALEEAWMRLAPELRLRQGALD